MKKEKKKLFLSILLILIFIVLVLTIKGCFTGAKIKFIERKDKNEISINDLVQIGDTEQFYVIDTNNDETTLMAKYNLYVGAIYSEYDEKNNKYYLEKTITDKDNGYCLQNKNATGNIDKKSKTVGGVYFSSNRYWVDSKKYLLPQYGKVEYYRSDWVDNNIYNSKFKGDKNNNYSIAYYIELYVDTLKSFGLKNITGRVLTLNELDKLGCHKSNFGVDCTEAPDYVTNSSYWISTAFNDTFVYTSNYDIIPYNGNNRSSNYVGSYLKFDKELQFYSLAGVKPVIVIPTSILK